MDKCPKCGGQVKVLERSLQYWGGVHCEAIEQNSDSPASPVQQTQPKMPSMNNWLNFALSGEHNMRTHAEIYDYFASHFGRA